LHVSLEELDNSYFARNLIILHVSLEEHADCRLYVIEYDNISCHRMIAVLTIRNGKHTFVKTLG